jgi:hypothetical protein
MRTKLGMLMAAAALFLFSASGCESKNVGVGKNPTTTDEHEHHHGPNEGELIELGNEEYHAELLQVPDGDVVTVFILDKEAKNAVPTATEAVVVRMTLGDKPIEFRLTPNPKEGEPAGSSSRFESKEEPLRAALAHQTAKRELEVKIGDKTYKGEFEYYEPHQHGHAHEEGKHDDHTEADHKDEPKADAANK